MLPERHISVRADENSQLRCVTCQELMAENNICLMLRLEPGGTFDPLCVNCSRSILTAARRQLELSQDLYDLIKL